MMNTPTLPKPPTLPPAGTERDYNPLGLDYREPWSRPNVRGTVIDWHSHLLAARHADTWFEAARHFGIDYFVTMAPLEEAPALKDKWGDRLHFIAVAQWGDQTPQMIENWRARIDAFHKLGSRVAKFHAAPQTMSYRGFTLDDDRLRPVFQDVVDRGMILMSHIGDPELWYKGRYSDASKYDAARFGNRERHYQMWERLLQAFPQTPWVGAHLGGNPEDFPRLQKLLDEYPQVYLDLSATRWMVREISLRPIEAREFVIRNDTRLLWGSDQVSQDDRGFDFLASRFWAHRKLWETDHCGPSNMHDPDLPPETQPQICGLALPPETLQRIYHDNAISLLGKVGVHVPASLS